MWAAVSSLLRPSTRGRHHFDIGPVTGYATVLQNTSDSATFVGLRLAYAWEGEHHGTSVAITPLIFIAEPDANPGIYASLRWELPI